AAAYGHLARHDRLTAIGLALAAPVPPAASDAASAADADREHVRATSATAIYLLMCGHQALADRLVDIIEPRVAAFSDHDPAVAAAILRIVGLRTMFGGDLGASVTATTASIEAYQRAGDQPGVCRQRVNLGADLIALGAYAEARDLLTETQLACE